MKSKKLLSSKTASRNTPIKQAIEAIFKSAKNPLTVPMLRSELKKKNISPNKTTLYRQIEKFLETGFIHKVSVQDGVSHYELNDSHHHHFVCSTCGVVECIPEEKIGSLEKEVHNLVQKMQNSGLKISGHEFSLQGKCKSCL